MKKEPTQVAEMVKNEGQQSEESIRIRAYALYESRGREDGHDLDDWLCAEKEIRKEKVRGVAA